MADEAKGGGPTDPFLSPNDAPKTKVDTASLTGDLMDVVENALGLPDVLDPFAKFELKTKLESFEKETPHVTDGGQNPNFGEMKLQFKFKWPKPKKPTQDEAALLLQKHIRGRINRKHTAEVKKKKKKVDELGTTTSKNMVKDEDKDNPFVNVKYPDQVGPPMKDEHFLRGSTEMHKAAALLKLDEVDKLLVAGNDDYDTGDVLNQTPLLLLARNHYDPEDVPKAVEMMKKLLAAGATIVIDGKCRRDDYGDSLLHLCGMASGKNGPAIMQVLLDALPAGEKGKLCSARCKNFGNTALHWATLGGNVETCQALIDAGARMDRLNRLKESVLDYAVKYEHPKLKVKYEALSSK